MPIAVRWWWRGGVIDGTSLVAQVAALNKKHAETLKALYLVMYARRFQLKNVRPSTFDRVYL